jgi:site-specific DNA recombinase
MTAKSPQLMRCAIYTRKSTEHGMELEFNSLDAQREACEAYIKSQAHEGWQALNEHYDDPARVGKAAHLNNASSSAVTAARAPMSGTTPASTPFAPGAWMS